MSWTIVGDAPPGKDRHRRVLARCDCGIEKIVVLKNIYRRQSTGCKACACRRKATKHGSARVGNQTPEYRAWCSMITRCTNQNREKWNNYGGRGISVCKRWRDSFSAFLADVGPRPSSAHSLDRINNDGDYEPGNVRWATAVQQANNRRPRSSRRRVIVTRQPQGD